MLEILLIIVFAWFFIGSVGLIFRLTCGLAKIIGSLVLFVIALPILILGFFLVGGVFLLCPVLIVIGAFTLLKRCF